MKKLILFLFLIPQLCFGATLTLIDSDASTIVWNGDVVVQGASSLKQSTVIGALTADAGSTLLLQNTIATGAITWTANLNASSGYNAFVDTAASGAGTYPDSTHTLWGTALPFKSASDLTPKKSRKDIWCGGADIGITEDIAGRTLPYKSCFPIGAYRFSGKAGAFGFDFGF